ncbi:extensin-like domain-containing protein [Sphingopyxis sp. MWB1]|uniref:extensin-like domain-containing protein n=1 Tax=Sphingopyxis sp. MWB1 TaxID=1537715 RepID=UPI00051A46AF|nr:extensin family protein [Sphingopyxis sp. MWB1]
MRSFRSYLTAFILLILGAFAVIRGIEWLRAHPQHNMFAPFNLADPQGWATSDKLQYLVGDDAACFAAFDRAEAGYERLPPVGEGPCRAKQRMTLTGNALVPSLAPAGAGPGCAVTAGLALWTRDAVQPLARQYFGQKVVRMENMGSYNCRPIAGRDVLSEHSTANAIDISAFILADGTRISLLRDWSDAGAKGQFLRRVRDGACTLFSTTLSPDYNQAHADHFHLDMAERSGGWTVCR